MSILYLYWTGLCFRRILSRTISCEGPSLAPILSGLRSRRAEINHKHNNILKIHCISSWSTRPCAAEAGTAEDTSQPPSPVASWRGRGRCRSRSPLPPGGEGDHLAVPRLVAGQAPVAVVYEGGVPPYGPHHLLRRTLVAGVLSAGVL